MMQTTEPTERLRDQREITGAAVAVIGLAIAFVGASISLWHISNPWDAPAPIPAGMATGHGVTWWGVLGSDPRDRTHLATSVMVSVVPVVIVALAAILPLVVRRWRPWFGPLVAIASAMWFAQILGWSFMYGDYWDYVEPAAGFFLIAVGLLLAIGAALFDAHEVRLDADS